MNASKCLDLDCFGLFSWILYGRKYNSRSLKNIIHEFDIEHIVTLGLKVMTTSSKYSHCNYFKLLSYPLVRSSIFERDWNKFFI